MRGRDLLNRAMLVLVPCSTFALPVAAQDGTDERPYCAARPGLGTTPCTIAPRRVSIEIALADWERDSHSDWHDDTMLVGGVAARFGLGSRSELSIEWTPFGETWAAGSGLPTRRGLGTGDLTVSTKVNLRNPDGAGLSLAVQPFLGLPVGGTALGSGHWATGVVLPVSVAVGGPFSLQATPQLTLEQGDEGERSQLSGRMTGGLGVALGEHVSLTQELSFGRDHQDGEAIVRAFAATSVAYQTTSKFQFDVGGVFGLNDASPDARFYVGASHQF